MNCRKRICKAFDNALRLPLLSDSKYVILSDCHRGTGRNNDNFLKNEFIYTAALKHYFDEGFTYLELGDGDELWENPSFEDIKTMHSEVFGIMSNFFQDGRFYSVYGNHDIIKKNPKFVNSHFHTYYCENGLCHKPLFPHISFYPSIILEDKEKKKDIYLTHGHQSDMLNSTFWPLSRFLVRFLWHPLENLGIPDPTSAAKNNTRKRKTEKRLTLWAKENNFLLITGHTHRPMIGTPDSPYFNTGSCVSPSGITCIEIENRCLSLVKWSVGTKSSQVLYVRKEILGENICIDDY